MKRQLGFRGMHQKLLIQILLLLTGATNWVLRALVISEGLEIQDPSGSISSADIEAYTSSESILRKNGARKFDEDDDVIILVTVGGDISGVSQSSGELLWKKSASDSILNKNQYEQTNEKDWEKQEILFAPLVSTTTTTHSEAWRMCK